MHHSARNTRLRLRTIILHKLIHSKSTSRRMRERIVVIFDPSSLVCMCVCTVMKLADLRYQSVVVAVIRMCRVVVVV